MNWKAMNWRVIGTLGLLAGALLSGWLMWQQRDRGASTGPIGKRPDYVLHDFQATVLHLLGIDHTRLTYKFQGRYFRLTDVHGKVVRELLA